MIWTRNRFQLENFNNKTQAESTFSVFMPFFDIKEPPLIGCLTLRKMCEVVFVLYY